MSWQPLQNGPDMDSMMSTKSTMKTLELGIETT